MNESGAVIAEVTCASWRQFCGTQPRHAAPSLPEALTAVRTMIRCGHDRASVDDLLPGGSDAATDPVHAAGARHER
jgi:hypothetical protein